MENKELTLNQAIDILIQSVELGCQRGAYASKDNCDMLINMIEIGRQRGAYTFPEASLINTALTVINDKKNL